VFGPGAGKGGSAGVEEQDASTGGSPDLGGSSGSGGGITMDVVVNTETSMPGCSNDPTVDDDEDGYTENDGDCNDCDPNTNPGAFDDGETTDGDGGPPVDVNCDGTPGGDTHECDEGIALDDTDAKNAARAIGLCKFVAEDATGKDKTWGVIEAKYVKADGTPGMNKLSHGILPNFGQNGKPQQGVNMLGLSSGTARGPSMPGYESPSGAQMGTTCAAPIPNMDSPSCPGVKSGAPNDPAALEVKLRVPTNTKSFKFYFNFYTYEFPIFICSQYNDFFVTLMNPKPEGSPNGNISFDQLKNPVSVNNSMLQVCKAQTAGGKKFECPLGEGLLAGTGFEGHAATGWLQTVAPLDLPPGSVVTLRWAIWDAGDQVLDSTVLVDNFEFSVEPAAGASTEPVPIPK
jgi:hypothetical protein